MTFDEAFERLIGNEGGYTPGLPGDPGGETNWGISKRSYPNVDIASLTREQAAEIYKRDFWDVLGDAEPALKFQVFDFAVNSGVQTAIRKLQYVLGVADDGHWGPVSGATLASKDAGVVLIRYVAERLRFMTKCAVWQTLSAGLANRIAKQLDYAAGDLT